MTNSILSTDGYKFSMMEGGFPLRRETFYYSHRKGGPHYLPVDVESFIRDRLPQATQTDFDSLDRSGYQLGGASRESLRNPENITITTIPKGSWFFDREPVFSIEGPSGIVSWLEPLALQLNIYIQIATCALRTPHLLARKVRQVTCHAERDIVLQILHDLGLDGFDPLVCPFEYQGTVKDRAQELVNVVGDPNRIFEVGLRAVSCNEQHELALEAIRATGITKTSNVEGAFKTFMIPVGTMGHEHIQRHGSDYAAFTAMRDRHPGFVFYLPDTFSTMESGVPTALQVMREDLSRVSGIRFDSESAIEEHYRFTIAAIRAIDPDWHPVLALESGWNLELTKNFEAIREELGWPADKQVYGYGGYLVKPPWPHFSRDDVSAVWKITETGGRPTMKFGDEPNGGKSSIPGRPVIWRPNLADPDYMGPVGIIAQEGEPVPEGMTLISGDSDLKMFSVENVTRKGHTKAIPSPMTEKLIATCVAMRDMNMRK